MMSDPITTAVPPKPFPNVHFIYPDVHTITPKASQPVRQSFSRQEILVEARNFMVKQYGSPKEHADRDWWHTRFGLLVHFITETFPDVEGNSTERAG